MTGTAVFVGFPEMSVRVTTVTSDALVAVVNLLPPTNVARTPNL